MNPPVKLIVPKRWITKTVKHFVLSSPSVFITFHNRLSAEFLHTVIGWWQHVRRKTVPNKNCLRWVIKTSLWKKTLSTFSNVTSSTRKCLFTLITLQWQQMFQRPHLSTLARRSKTFEWTEPLIFLLFFLNTSHCIFLFFYSVLKCYELINAKHVQTISDKSLSNVAVSRLDSHEASMMLVSSSSPRGPRADERHRGCY